MRAYTRLFEEGRIGELAIPNRIVMPAMGTVLCNADGSVSNEQIAYYEERARGGCGLIVTEIIAVENRLGKAVAVQTRADEDRFIPGLARLAAAIHKYPTRVFPQLHHAGNQSNSRITGGEQIVAPSAVASGAIGEEPRALTKEEIVELVERFAAAAQRCKTAGFDGVELHGAHGYLINEFLSPRTNLRTDEYGGSLENRIRFVSEIIGKIKEVCGTDFPVMVRYSADEFLDDGIDLEQGKAIARHLEQAGADGLDVSCGTYESMHTLLEPITYPEGWRVYLAETIKREVKIPVVTVGVIRRPSFAEEVLFKGRADFVAIGRDMLTDPEWANKARDGRDDEICHCIACLYCIETIFAARPIACAVNARTGNELHLPEPPADGAGMPVAVIGGGPGGMEAARLLARRGFHPILFEKGSELGGELLPGCRPPKKDKIAWYKDYLNRQMSLHGVEVRLDTEATPEMVKKEKPHAVIVAVGAVPRMPDDVPGIPGPKVCNFMDVLWGRRSAERDQSVLVVGAGLTGCETAVLLAEQGAKVTLIDIRQEMASGEHPINATGAIMQVKESGITFIPERRLLEVRHDAVEVERVADGGRESLGADLVVIAVGLKVDESMIRPWLDNFERVRVIGDAISPRKVAQAVREGYDAAYVLEPTEAARPTAEAAAPAGKRKTRQRPRPSA